MKSSLTVLLLISSIILYSCTENPTDTTKPSADIDALVRDAGTKNTSLVEKKVQTAQTTETITENGKKYELKKTSWSLAKNLDNNIIPFNPNANTLWAGAIVQGNEVPNGILNSIGDNIPRTPITITAKSGDKLFGNATIENPSNAKYSSSLSTVLKTVTGNSVANMIFQKQEAYSKEQASMELGMSAKWFVGSASGNFNTANSSTEKNIYIFFKQEYYTVSVNEPSKPSDYFASTVDINDLKSKVSTGNPLCYVASVTYGRLLMAKMTYKGEKSMDDVKTAVTGAFGVANGKGNYNKNSDVEKSTFDGIILGGSAGGAAKALTGASIQSIVDFINEEANYSADSPGYPISYTVKNLADNSIVKLGETTDYTVNEYTESSDNFQNFSLHIEGFYVINDCEPIGNGDFYYNLNVVDQDNKSLINGGISVPTNQTIPAGDAAWVSVKRDYDFKLNKSSGANFRVVGKISEDNSLVSDTDVPFDKAFSFPWADADLKNDWKIGTEAGYYGLEMFRDAGCKIVLILKITKK